LPTTLAEGSADADQSDRGGIHRFRGSGAVRIPAFPLHRCWRCSPFTSNLLLTGGLWVRRSAVTLLRNYAIAFVNQATAWRGLADVAGAGEIQGRVDPEGMSVMLFPARLSRRLRRCNGDCPDCGASDSTTAPRQRRDHWRDHHRGRATAAGGPRDRTGASGILRQPVGGDGARRVPHGGRRSTPSLSGPRSHLGHLP
jgi:hypothetical protein